MPSQYGSVNAFQFFLREINRIEKSVTSSK